jgi:hypothetical protein
LLESAGLAPCSNSASAAMISRARQRNSRRRRIWRGQRRRRSSPLGYTGVLMLDQPIADILRRR